MQKLNFPQIPLPQDQDRRMAVAAILASAISAGGPENVQKSIEFVTDIYISILENDKQNSMGNWVKLSDL